MQKIIFVLVALFLVSGCVKDHEIDFLFQSGRELIPIEVKSATTFNRSFLDNLLFFKDLFKERMKEGFVVYGGTEKQSFNSFTLLPYNQATHALSPLYKT